MASSSKEVVAVAVAVAEGKEEVLAVAEGKKITLISSDGGKFVIDEIVAMESQTIKHVIEDNFAGSGIPIPIPKVTGEILAKVIEYIKKHVEWAPKIADKAVTEELKNWDAEFAKVDQSTLFNLIQAAHYLGIEGLMELTFQTIATTDMIYEKIPEENRTILNIMNEYPPEESGESEGF